MMAELLALLDSKMMDASWKLEHAESEEDIQRYSKELIQIEEELDEALSWHWQPAT